MRTRLSASALVRAVTSEPSTGVKLLSKLLALGLVAVGRRVRASVAWHSGTARLRYRRNLIVHPLHVRYGVPAHLVGCFCDLRLIRGAA